ncbi:MAG TPA: ABC transporter transmembrane domain-containing protein, partial [Vicinamibacterales bacterium]
MIADLARPYRRLLLVILSAMIIETLAGLAGPWPLKVVIDNIAAPDRRPDWPTLALLAAGAVVLIALVHGVASYVDNYYTESVGQRVANDLRMRVYDHLECLSFSYYDTHQTGELLSTITDDVATVQDFISSSTISIVVDAMTIAGMLALMFWLNWRFSLFVLLITPILLLCVNRFRKAVKRATREVRRRQSDIVAVIQSGLESIRTVQAFDAREIEVSRLNEVSRATVDAALNARRVKSLLS